MKRIMVIPKNARALRTILGFTCQQVGDACGLTKQSVSNFETKYASMTKEQLLRTRILYTSGLVGLLTEDRDKFLETEEYWKLLTEEVETIVK